MATTGRNYEPDGFQVINLGVNSGSAPNTLNRQQLAWAINTTTRGGFPRTRPGWKKQALQFLDADGAVDTTLRDDFEDGLFQGAIASERRNQIIASIAGQLFTIDIDSFNVRDVSISGDLNRSDLRRAWMVEAEDWIIVQDNDNRPIIYNGATSRRSDTAGEGGATEVPSGAAMSYNTGRLWVSLPDRRSFVAGDLVYGPSGSAEFQKRDAVLKFTENNFLNGGGAFAVPINAGEITAMAPVAQIDTSQGQGPLQVFTDRGVFSVNAPVERASWQDLEYPIQSVSGVNFGATSDRCAVNVNGDIWMRSIDGIRSFQVARRDFGTWVNTPQSHEVERVVEKDTPELLQYASGAVFDNRLFVTAAPHTDWTHGTYHLGMYVLDFSPVSAITEVSTPVWEGIWTGLKILQIVSGSFNGVTRMFALTLGDDDDIELYELTKDAEFDFDGSDDVEIACSIETPSFNWQDGGFGYKELQHSEIWYDQIRGEVSFTAQYRPDQEPCWQSLSTWTSCATKETCTTQEDDTECGANQPDVLHRQYRNIVRIPVPGDTCDSITGKPYRHGYEFQFRLSWTGAARIKKFRAFTTARPEPVLQTCANATGESCAELVCASCESDIGDYEIE